MKKTTTMVFRMTQDEYESASEDYQGRCLACGAEAYGVEPDARGYECEECEAKRVYGLEELLMMGLVTFTDED